MGKRGPKPTGPYANQRAVLSTRITEDLRADLEKGAAKSGRTVSREVETRLRSYFDHARAAEEIFGGRDLYALMRLIASAIAITDNPLTGKSWRDDPYAFDQAIRAVMRVLESFRPAGDMAAPYAIAH